MRMLLSVLLMVVVGAVGFATGAIEYAGPIETARDEGDLSAFLDAVEAADLSGVLRGAGPITVFAPTDRAFDLLPEGVLDALLADRDALREILRYHIVPAAVRTDQIDAVHEELTLQGEPLSLAWRNGTIHANHAALIRPDLETSNGVMHVIDQVLIPPSIDLARLLADDLYETIAAHERLTTLARAIREAGIEDTFASEGPFTVFAPSDAAFEKLPPGALPSLLSDASALARTLRYHVAREELYAGDLNRIASSMTLADHPVAVTLEGATVYVNDSRLGETDIQAKNGVVHLVDTVLLPPSDTILEVLRDDGRFGRLLQLLEAADLARTFGGSGPYTLFAPTDSAFRRVPPRMLESLLADRSRLADTILYHVLDEYRFSRDVARTRRLESVQGGAITVRRSGASVLLNGEANVTAVNYLATNGVIHVIDRVLMPSGR
ncbi:MAG: fasciclin domain-containing protein [Spirochaetota bacterium]